jgi:hypothetical protein
MRRLWWGQIITAAAAAAVVVLFSLGRPLKLWELISWALATIGWSLESRAHRDRASEFETMCEQLLNKLEQRADGPVIWLERR